MKNILELSGAIRVTDFIEQRILERLRKAHKISNNDGTILNEE